MEILLNLGIKAVKIEARLNKEKSKIRKRVAELDAAIDAIAARQVAGEGISPEEVQKLKDAANDLNRDFF